MTRQIRRTGPGPPAGPPTRRNGTQDHQGPSTPAWGSVSHLWAGLTDLWREISEHRSWPRCQSPDPIAGYIREHDDPAYPGVCGRFLCHWGDHLCVHHGHVHIWRA